MKRTKLKCPIHSIPLNISTDWKSHNGLDPKMIRAACNDCNDYWYKAPKRCWMRKNEAQAAFGIVI